MLRDETIPRSRGPSRGKLLVVFYGTDAVGVAVDDDGILLDARVLQHRGDFVELAARLRRELGRVECKVHGTVERAWRAANAGSGGDPAQPTTDHRHGALRIECAEHLVM